uniref:ATP-dependent sacrificial sulfur transferase LarE n=1 Tax=Archaeoglobus fulgidus TaxID=2234 RepID=A0A7J2TI70_ARCFL
MPSLFEKLQKMKEFLGQFKSVLIAFSGGVDSSTLVAICKELGIDVIAVTVFSEVSPSREMRDSVRIANEIGVKHEIVSIDILDADFVKNDEKRCYYCKKKIFSKLLSMAEEKGCQLVLEGTNASDLAESRMGYLACRELGVFSPWAEFGIKKDEIREIAKSMGFSFYDKPSLACLASRIPHGIEIDREKLRMVDEAEEAIIEIAKVRQVRVRNYDGVAVIEVGEDEIPKLLEKALMVREKVKEIGFRYVLIDLDGYKAGKRIFGR